MEMNIFLIAGLFLLLFLGAPIFVALCLPTVHTKLKVKVAQSCPTL